MPQEKVKIENIEDLYYYYDLIDQSQVDEQSIEIALDDFISSFDVETSYTDSLNRLQGHVDCDIAAAIIKFQDFVNETYKIVKYQDQDVNLSEDELNSVKIYIKVDEGSSKLKYAKAIAKIFNQVTDSMTSKQKIIFATLIMSVVTAGVVVNNVAQKYIEGETQVALSQQETVRSANIINGYSKIRSEVDTNILYKTIETEGKKAVLDPVKKNDGVTLKVTTNPNDSEDLQDTKTINQEEAKTILKPERSRSNTDVLESHFKINGILNSSEQGKVKVQISTSDGVLNGTVEIRKDDEDIDFISILNNFSEENPIELVVRTRTIKGKTKIDKILATVGTLQ